MLKNNNLPPYVEERNIQQTEPTNLTNEEKVKDLEKQVRQLVEVLKISNQTLNRGREEKQKLKERIDKLERNNILLEQEQSQRQEAENILKEYEIENPRLFK